MRVLKPQENNCGYLRVQLSNKGKSKKFFIHRLVASTFLSNIPDNMQINHKDGNKKNNCISNLEIVTASQNAKHRYSHLKVKPTRLFNENNGKTKITLTQIQEARDRRSSGEMLKDIAMDFNINAKYLGSILNGKRRIERKD